MGGKRLWNMRVGALEHDAISSERVEGRSADRTIAVCGQVVGPKRVDRDENDRPIHRGRRLGKTPAAEGSETA